MTDANHPDGSRRLSPASFDHDLHQKGPGEHNANMTGGQAYPSYNMDFSQMLLQPNDDDADMLKFFLGDGAMGLDDAQNAQQSGQNTGMRLPSLSPPRTGGILQGGHGFGTGVGNIPDISSAFPFDSHAAPDFDQVLLGSTQQDQHQHQQHLHINPQQNLQLSSAPQQMGGSSIHTQPQVHPQAQQEGLQQHQQYGQQPQINAPQQITQFSQPPQLGQYSQNPQQSQTGQAQLSHLQLSQQLSQDQLNQQQQQINHLQQLTQPPQLGQFSQNQLSQAGQNQFSQPQHVPQQPHGLNVSHPPASVPTHLLSSGAGRMDTSGGVAHTGHTGVAVNHTTSSTAHMFTSSPSPSLADQNVIGHSVPLKTEPISAMPMQRQPMREQQGVVPRLGDTPGEPSRESTGDGTHTPMGAGGGGLAFQQNPKNFPFGMSGSAPLMMPPQLMMHSNMLGAVAAQQQENATANDERRQKRLARNRESARQSRRRKKQYLELLEEKVAHLSEEIEGLRLLHLEGASRTLRTLRVQQLQRLEQALDALTQAGQMGNDMSAGPPQSLLTEHVDLATGVRDLLKRFGPACEDRLAVVSYQFEYLDTLIMPGYSRFLLWLMDQPEDFFRGGSRTAAASCGQGPATAGVAMTSEAALLAPWADRATGVSAPPDRPRGERGGAGGGVPKPSATSSLWSLLCHDLGLSSEQEDKIKSCQQAAVQDLRVASDRWQLTQLLKLLTDLRSGVEAYLQTVQRRADQLAKLMAPAQTVKYLSWVQRNKVALSRCVEDLTTRAVAATSPNEPPGTELVTLRVHELLAKPDGELTLDELTWLMQWVKSSREWRGAEKFSTTASRARFPMLKSTSTSELGSELGVGAALLEGDEEEEVGLP